MGGESFVPLRGWSCPRQSRPVLTLGCGARQGPRPCARPWLRGTGPLQPQTPPLHVGRWASLGGVQGVLREHGGHWSPAGLWTPQGVRPGGGALLGQGTACRPPPGEVCRGLDSRPCEGGLAAGVRGLGGAGGGGLAQHGGAAARRVSQGRGGAGEPRGLWESLVRV